MNMRMINCVLLPAAGRRTQLFQLIFTEPRAHHIVHPCICSYVTQNKGKYKGASQMSKLDVLCVLSDLVRGFSMLFLPKYFRMPGVLIRNSIYDYQLMNQLVVVIRC